MGRKMKKLTRVGAGALAGVMVFGLAAPLAPLSVEAADEVKNLAIGSTATASEVEAGTQFNAEKAVDGTVDRIQRNLVGQQIHMAIRRRSG